MKTIRYLFHQRPLIPLFYIEFSLSNFTFQDDIESKDPLLKIYVILSLCVEVFVNSVHDDVICQVKIVMEEFSKLFPINLSTIVVAFLEVD